MDTHHLLFNYSTWTTKRKEMREKCEKERGGKPRMISQLIGSRKTTPAVLYFMVAIPVGKRAQKLEPETEKQQSEMDESWGLDEDRLKGEEVGERGEEREERERGGEG